LDEFLSEKEQLERIRAWWRENGWYLVGGAVLGALLLFGWNRYRAHELQQAELASALYDELREAVEANTENRARLPVDAVRGPGGFARRPSGRGA
jgi:predicted negative regulator of RcsB-dependent stress response